MEEDRGRAGAAGPSAGPAPPAAPADGRLTGLFDARFHSTAAGATPSDLRVLPKRIILVRHGESVGNIDHRSYTNTPDPQLPLTNKGLQQAAAAGRAIRQLTGNEPVFFYLSPYRRSLLTFDGIKVSRCTRRRSGGVVGD